MKGTLYLIPTPLAEQAIEKSIVPELRALILKLKYFLVENERSARRFLKAVDKSIVIDDLKMVILDKRSTEDEVLDMMMDILNGEDAGVITEAGCPGIADPGALLAEMCHQNQIEVKPLVGPSSILLALMASGMNGQGFTFHGYLPIDKKERTQAVRAIERELFGTSKSQIFMETPYRNNQLLAQMLQTCNPNTKLCIACNITGAEEMIKTKHISEWKQNTPDLNKKPTIFVLGK